MSNTAAESSIPQAVVAGSLDENTSLTGRAGSVEFPIGGPGEFGGSPSGANPYDLLSVSLAACTAMTIRMQARHKKYPLSHVEVAVSYHHADGDGRGSFERSITLEGPLSDEQRMQLVRGASACPVGQALRLSAEIQTHAVDKNRVGAYGAPADYAEDLEGFSLVNIDPD